LVANKRQERKEDLFGTIHGKSFNG